MHICIVHGCMLLISNGLHVIAFVSHRLVFFMLVGHRYAQDQFGLVIRNVTKDDEGIYTCRAEVDADGRYDERPINVIVYGHLPHSGFVLPF